MLSTFYIILVKMHGKLENVVFFKMAFKDFFLSQLKYSVPQKISATIIDNINNTKSKHSSFIHTLLNRQLQPILFVKRAIKNTTLTKKNYLKLVAAFVLICSVFITSNFKLRQYAEPYCYVKN